MKIILDTNFLITAVKNKLNIFEELKGNEIFTLYSIIKELEEISKGNSKDAECARVALIILNAEGVKKIKSDGPVDPSLVELSKKGYVIATQDKNLRTKIKRRKGRVVIIRQNKKLEER